MLRKSWRLPVFLLGFAALGPARAEGTLQACAALSDPAARLACYDALAAAPKPAGSDFGKPPPTARDEPVEARIVGDFKGWKRGQLFTLDNGQVWKCVDEREGFYPDAPANAEVIITKSWLGNYAMEVKSLGRWFHVQRVQ